MAALSARRFSRSRARLAAADAYLQVAFYYIDYALAQTCALQFLFMDETDHAAAWRCYLELLRQSGRFGFHDTLWQAGLQSPFEPASIRDIGLRAQALLNQMNEVIG